MTPAGKGPISFKVDFVNLTEERCADMDLENTPRKQLNELEITVTALLAMMRKAKIQDEALINMLKSFEKELAAIRHKRFDASNSEYRGY